MENENENLNSMGASDSVGNPGPENWKKISMPETEPSQPPRNAFEVKRSRRIERLRDRADRKRKEGERSLAKAGNLASFIPPGQPILVGHHSERRHRRDLERIDGLTRKGFDALDASKRLEQRAISAEENRAIFSDDPAAGEKLEIKIARLESRQTLMRDVNRFIRAKKSLASLGFSEAAEARLKTPDFLGRIGFPDYALKNNGANIRRLKTRLEALRMEEQRPIPAELEKNGISLIENVDENRVQLFFPGKPSDAVRKRLKRDGFRWSPINGCWQRHRSLYATQLAKQYLEQAEEVPSDSV